MHNVVFWMKHYEYLSQVQLLYLFRENVYVFLFRENF